MPIGFVEEEGGGETMCFVSAQISVLCGLCHVASIKAREQTPRINKWESSSLIYIFMAGFGVVLT